MPAAMTIRPHRSLSAKLLYALAIISALAVIAFFAAFPRFLESQMSKVRKPSASFSSSAHAAELHRKLLIADLHADSLLFGRDLSRRSRFGHIDLPRLREGNVTLQVFTAVTKAPLGINIERNSSNATDIITFLAVAECWPIRSWSSLQERALSQAARLNQLAQRSNRSFVIVHNRADLDELVRRKTAGENVVGGLLGIEGAHALEGKLENLAELKNAGYRMIGLAHFFDNQSAGSAHGVDKGGLTPQGVALIKMIEENHMIVDLAHASPKTIDDVLAWSHRPMLVSHTGVKGTCDNRRNLSDDHLKQIAARGGIIGIGYWETAVCGKDAKAIAKTMHYTANLIGADHVALGSDFDGAVTTPFDTAGLIQITDALIQEGFTDEQVGQIMGGNVLRFLKENLP